MKFSDIPIDRTDIQQSDLDITNKVRSNLFSWNGQFSPQFIESLLNNYATDATVVFDPFLGSGTTLCECARQGIAAFGTELNVSAYFMANIYGLCNQSLQYRKDLILKIDDILQQIQSDDQIVSLIVASIEEHSMLSDWVSDTLSLLIILLDIFKNEVTLPLLSSKWNKLKETILDLPESSRLIKAYNGDARRINKEDNSASLLISSPPYINVFNYHQNYRRSVEALGYDVLSIARSEFGSNRKNRGNRLLTVIQYCIDMALSIAEASRVCEEGSRMIYVVGRESSVLGYSFCNSELVYNIAVNSLGLSFLMRQERVFKNRFGHTIFEDIIHFSNTKKACSYDHDIIVEFGRAVAIEALREKNNFFPDNKNSHSIIDAIANAYKVKESEVNYERHTR